MQSKRLTQLVSTAMMAFVIMLSVLAPAISQIIASAQGQRWVEVCTLSGVKFVKLSADASDNPPLSKQTLKREHCAYCSARADLPGVLPSWNLLLPQLLSVALMPVLYYQSPQPLAVWRTARSRAPPASL